MTDGQSTLSALETSIQDLQQRERALQAELEAANTQRSALVERRLKTIRELAEVRTRSALADGVIDHSDRLSDRVASLLDARGKTLAALTARHKQAQDKRREQLTAHEILNGSIAALEERLDETANAVRQDKAAQPAYAAAVEQSEAAQSTLERGQAKAEQAHEDRSDKGRPYENDPLFMYLWQRKYGSSAYEAMPLIRWLDGKVANLVRYHDARANYSVLLQIPGRLDAHVSRLAAEAKTAIGAVDQIEAELIAQRAGADLVGALEAERAAYATENAELARLADEIAEISSQLNRYAEGHDHAFRQAIELTAGFLEDENLSRLKSAARATVTPSDDQIVERIAKIEGETENLREQSEDNRDELEALFRKKSELMRVASEFRRRQYDDPGSVFIPQGAGQVILQELLRGAINAAEYWARTRSSHRWRSRAGDSYRRRSSSWPVSGDFDWGSSGGRSSRDWGDEDFYTDDSF